MHTAYREPTNISKNTKPRRNGRTGYGIAGTDQSMRCGVVWYFYILSDHKQVTNKFLLVDTCGHTFMDP